MFLQSFLTTIPRPDDHPVKVAELGFREGTRVTIPYLDSRTCSGILLDMHEEIVSKLFVLDDDGVAIRDKTLALALKVYYRGKIVFHGPLSAPRYDFDLGKIELVAHDPSLRLKRAFLRSGDSALTDGITFDGEGLLELLALAQNTAAQDALNWPALGILPGVDKTTDAVGEATKLDRGENIWEAMRTIAESITNPDFELEPIETDPAELASGTDIWDTGAVIGDGSTLDAEIDVTRTGTVAGLRVAIFAEHADPENVNVYLIDPNGQQIKLYTGSRDDAQVATDWLGELGDFAVFQPGGTSIYAADDTYPHTGTYRGDQSLAALYDQAAAGTWTLRIEDTVTNTMTGFLTEWRLLFDLPAPAYCRLNVSDKPDTDALTNDIDPAGITGPSCVFHKGHGQETAKTLIVTPQGDLVRNQAIATSKFGTKIRVDDASRADYGTYQSFDSPGDQRAAAFLEAMSDGIVGAYSRPIEAIEVAPVDDGGLNETLRYGEDFFVGRHVRAIGKRGNAYWDVLGRVTQVVLLQGKSAVECEMDVEPAIQSGVSGDET